MEFEIQNSLLFSEVPRDPASGFGDEPVNIEDSFLFSQPQVQPSQIRSDPMEAGVNDEREGAKRVKTLGGKEAFLKKRVRKPVDIDFSDSFFDIDALHEKVERKNKMKAALEAVRKSHREEIRQAREEAAGEEGDQYVPGVWTEKYRPKTFFQLCPAGNERRFRQVLHFLHAKKREKKILLVHGPSGIGKTSAVHLLARQAGYNVYEMNAANVGGGDYSASDKAENSSSRAQNLHVRMKTALFSNDVLGGTTIEGVKDFSKKTCLVIDEIECAPNAAALISTITKLVSSSKDVVTRPVICIVNDPYALKEMETLRQHSELVGFRRPTASINSGNSGSRRVNVSAQKAVKEYLQDISTAENLNMTKKDITELFETYEGDIRACINQMQFSGRKLDKSLFLSDDAVIETHKDVSLTWFSVVDRLFTRDPHLTKEEDALKVFDMLMSGEGSSSITDALEKVIQGCFDRYLEAAYLQDNHVSRPAEISDWLSFSDRGERLDSTTYSSLTPLKFWSLFSEINPPKYQDDPLLPNPRGLFFDTLEKQKKNLSVIKELHKNVPIKVKASCCGGSSTDIKFYVTEFLPHFDTMLSPPAGSSRVKRTMRPYEQNLIEKIHSIVKAFELKLETSKNIETGFQSLNFGPNWDPLTSFDTELCPTVSAQKSRIQNSKRSWLFPLVQTETELAALTKYKRVMAPTIKPEVKVKRAKPMSVMDLYTKSIDPTKKAEENKDENGDEAKAEVKEEVKDESMDEDEEPTEKVRIWVKYHEGFSNAVRKNIGWAELWE